MDVLNQKTYDAEEDKILERTQYSQMDKLLLPMEFQQPPVSTGVSDENVQSTKLMLYLLFF